MSKLINIPQKINNCEINFFSFFYSKLVKEKLAQDPDSEIATMSLRGSLLCPVILMMFKVDYKIAHYS